MKDYFYGKEPLWKAFWLVGVAGTVAILLLGYGIFTAGGAFRIPTAQLGVIFVQTVLRVLEASGEQDVVSSLQERR